jgi:hypothetical protein
MIHLKYECKVNFVKLPLISIYRCLKLIFENAISGRNAGCRSVVYRAGSTTFKESADRNRRTYQATSSLPAHPALTHQGGDKEEMGC